jgi:hypothetical protein
MNMDTGFGTWNIRCFYRAGSLMTFSKDLSRYKLDLVGVQNVRWVALSQHKNIHLSAERGLRIMIKYMFFCA